MALKPKNPSQTTHRGLVAAIMALLLAAAGGLAAWVSATYSSGRVATTLEPQTVGVFKYERPSQWVADQTNTADNTPTQRQVFTEPGPAARRLITSELRFNRPALPNAALGAVMQNMVRGMAQLRGTWPVRIDNMTGLVGQADLLDSEQQLRSLMIAALTVDGKRYFGVALSSKSLGDPIDALLIDRMVHSVVDRRYAALRSPIQLLEDLTLNLPAGLRGLKPAGQSEGRVLVVTPTQSLRYFLTAVSLTDLSVASSQLAELAEQQGDDGPIPPALATLLASMPRMSPVQRMETLVGWHYFKSRQKIPASGNGSATQIADRPVRALLVNPGRGAEPYQAIWGVLLDDQRMALMELIADPEAIAQVQAEARAIVSGFELSTEPGDRSDETSSAPDEKTASPSDATEPPPAKRTSP